MISDEVRQSGIGTALRCWTENRTYEKVMRLPSLGVERAAKCSKYFVVHLQ
jgi:hypothetical protein